MTKKLQLTGPASFSSPLTYGKSIKRGQIIKVSDADGIALLAIPATFTVYAGGNAESYDFTDDANPDPFGQRDGSVTVLPAALSVSPNPPKRGVLLRGADGIPYGYSNGLGGYIPNERPLVSGAGNSGSLLMDSLVGGVASPISSHYPLATFGDSRANIGGTHGSSASATVLAAEKVGPMLCQVRPDMRLTFNGGVSGGLAANWDNDSDTPTGRTTAGKSIAALLLSGSAACHVQLGINDIVGWNGVSPSQASMTATIITNLQACCAAIMAGGVFVIFESINPAAPASVSYINGYGASGGFGANAAAKLQMLGDVNTAMAAWLAPYSRRARYVDTSAATTGGDGYAKADGSYQDGTHLSMLGAMAAARLIDGACRDALPWHTNVALPGRSRNAVNGMLIGVAAGKGAGWATAADSGTWAADDWAVSGDRQLVTLTCTALSSGYARRLVTIAPSFVGASTLPALVAGDVIQARVEYEIDDGTGGPPGAYFAMLRGRIYYSDTTNEYTVHGQPTVLTSTDHPRMTAHAGYLMTPGLPIKAAMGNSTITASTQLQLMVATNVLGPTRLALRAAEWRKVA